MKSSNQLFLLVLLMLMPTLASADPVKINGIYYYLNSETNKAEVTFFLTPDYTSEDDYTGEIVIPRTVNYKGVVYSVTSIGDGAFSGCSGLTSITIPNNVTDIGDFAFQDCSNLTSITIPDNVTSIGIHAFYNCSGLTSITIPNNVTTIEYGIFWDSVFRDL